MSWEVGIRVCTVLRMSVNCGVRGGGKGFCGLVVVLLVWEGGKGLRVENSRGASFHRAAGRSKRTARRPQCCQSPGVGSGGNGALDRRMRYERYLS